MSNLFKPRRVEEREKQILLKEKIFVKQLTKMLQKVNFDELLITNEYWKKGGTTFILVIRENDNIYFSEKDIQILKEFEGFETKTKINLQIKNFNFIGLTFDSVYIKSNSPTLNKVELEGRFDECNIIAKNHVK